MKPSVYKNQGEQIMKALILVLSIISGSFAYGIEFDAPNADQKILVQIVRANLATANEMSTSAYDAEGRTRLILSSYTAGGTLYRQYSYYTSFDKSGGPQEISDADAEKLNLYLSTASVACPVAITFDRDTLSIIKVRATCDPLARAGSLGNQG
jgi:hypothetical protein